MRLFVRCSGPRTVGAALALILGAGLAPAGPGQTPRVAAASAAVPFSDGTFNDADWELLKFQIGGTAGDQTAIQAASGGTPGSYRQITDTFAPTGLLLSIFGFNGKLSAVYNPSAQGAIASVGYSEDSITISGGIQATGPALKQGGVVYVHCCYITTPSTPGVWANQGFTGLTANDFRDVLNSAATPDFSATGGPIEFGFVRANTTGVGGAPSGATNVAGIDNWSVTLTTQGAAPGATVPALSPGMLALFALTLAGAAIFVIQRR